MLMQKPWDRILHAEKHFNRPCTLSRLRNAHVFTQADIVLVPRVQSLAYPRMKPEASLRLLSHLPTSACSVRCFQLS